MPWWSLSTIFPSPFVVVCSWSKTDSYAFRSRLFIAHLGEDPFPPSWGKRWGNSTGNTRSFPPPSQPVRSLFRSRIWPWWFLFWHLPTTRRSKIDQKHGNSTQLGWSFPVHYWPPLRIFTVITVRIWNFDFSDVWTRLLTSLSATWTRTRCSCSRWLTTIQTSERITYTYELLVPQFHQNLPYIWQLFHLSKIESPHSRGIHHQQCTVWCKTWSSTDSWVTGCV